MRLSDDAQLHFSGGRINSANFSVEANDRSFISFTGAELLEGFRLLDSSRLRIDGDSPGSPYPLKAYGNSRAVVNSGGNVNIDLFESSRLLVVGGDIESLRLFGNSRVLATGGSYTIAMHAFDDSVIDWHGGGVAEDEPFQINGSATLNVYGTDLQLGTHEVFGNVVSGTFANGESFLASYRLQDQGQIILHGVPEPATWTLLAAGIASFAGSRSFWRRWRLS